MIQYCYFFALLIAKASCITAAAFLNGGWSSIDLSRVDTLLYNRVPKCGSSSMLSILTQSSAKLNFSLFSDSQYYPAEKEFKHRIGAWLSKHVRQNVVYVNHMAMPSDDMLQPFIFYNRTVAFINVVRNPLQRLQSHYEYARWGPRPLQGRTQALKLCNLTFSECLIQRNPSCAARSTLVDYLSGKRYYKSASGPLQQALSNVIRKYAFIGTVEQLPQTIEILSTLFSQFFAKIETVPHSRITHVDKSVHMSKRAIIARATAISEMQSDYALFYVVSDLLSRFRHQFNWGIQKHPSVVT